MEQRLPTELEFVFVAMSESEVQEPLSSGDQPDEPRRDLARRANLKPPVDLTPQVSCNGLG
jgi:hypothetical protein